MILDYKYIVESCNNCFDTKRYQKVKGSEFYE